MSWLRDSEGGTLWYPEYLEAWYGKVWSHEEFQREFTVREFTVEAAPSYSVIRNSDGARGSILYTRTPPHLGGRIYYYLFERGES
jgi:hypothetical protein